MQLWVVRGGRIFFFWYLGPILGGPGCTIAWVLLAWVMLTIDNRSLLTVPTRQRCPDCGAGVCAYMHVHVLEEKFFIAQFRRPPWQGWTGINSGKRLNVWIPLPKINMLSSNLIVVFHAGMMVCLDLWSRTSDWIWPCELQDKKSDSLYFGHCLAFLFFALTVWSNCRAQRVDMRITWSLLD